MLHSSDIKYVDMKHSEWDREKSDPKKGEYVFTGKKVYVNYFDKVRRPEWFLSMARYEPSNQFRDLLHWKHAYGYEPINVDTDGDWVWPEPLVPNENGEYVYRDLIVVKRKLIDELQDRVESIERSQGAAQQEIDAFDAGMRRHGADVSQESIRKAFNPDQE